MTDPTERLPAGSRPGAPRRAIRWLLNRQAGPLPRLRRMAGVVRTTVRGGGPWRSLPESIATALLAPVRVAGAAGPQAPPRDWSSERGAARERLEGGAWPHRWVDDLRIALIADEPIASAVRNESGKILNIRPEDWVAALDAAPPDLLLVTSARAGNRGAWTYRIGWYAHPDAFLHRDVNALLDWCRERSIPSVFWAVDANDDAAEFGDAAAGFDLILVSDDAAATGYGGVANRRGAGVGVMAESSADEGSLAAVREAMRAALGVAG